MSVDTQQSQRKRPCVFIESPYSGDIDRNVRYLMLCKLDSMVRGEMPCSSHCDMTQHPAKLDYYVSDYEDEWDIYNREQAIEISQSLRSMCEKTLFYTDLGLSRGMKEGIEFCKENDIKYEMRKIDCDNILSLKPALISYEFIDAIVSGKPYLEFIKKGTPTIPTI